MKEIIKLENVVRMIDDNRRSVNGVSLSINEKERVAVYGVSGSGKGTLMRLIAGMERPSDGKIFVADKAVQEMDADEAAVFRNRNIGIVRPEAGLMERLSVFDNVSLPLVIRGVPATRRNKEVKELLKTLGILHIADASPAHLSVYETRAVSIARALVAQPKILLMYEAAAGLSERDAERLIGTINAISKYGDYTLLSFSVNVTAGLRTDRTFLLEYGKIQEERS